MEPLILDVILSYRSIFGIAEGLISCPVVSVTVIIDKGTLKRCEDLGVIVSNIVTTLDAYDEGVIRAITFDAFPHTRPINSARSGTAPEQMSFTAGITTRTVAGILLGRHSVTLCVPAAIPVNNLFMEIDSFAKADGEDGKWCQDGIDLNLSLKTS